MATPREVFFEEAEYARRITAVQARMAEAGVDLLLTPNPGNICYLAGYFSGNVLDIMFLAVPREGTPVFYLWQFERGRAEASLVGAELVCWETGVEPIGFVAKDLDRRGLKRGHTAVDTGSTYTAYDVVANLMAALDAAPGKGLVESVRLVKSPAEHALIRKASVMTDAGTKAALDALTEGATDMEISKATMDALLDAGSEVMCVEPFICIGWRSGTPHAIRGGGVAKAGDPVFIELSGVAGRYNAPIMRTGVVGEPSPEVEELAHYSNAVIDTISGMMKDGVEIPSLAAAGTEVLAPIRDKIIFHDLFGYPIGVGFPPNWIENPAAYLSADNHTTLKAGMVYHLPTMLRVTGQYGAGFSETLIVHEDGVEVMSKLPRSLKG